MLKCPELSLMLYHHKIKGNYEVCKFGLRETKQKASVGVFDGVVWELFISLLETPGPFQDQQENFRTLVYYSHTRCLSV